MPDITKGARRLIPSAARTATARFGPFRRAEAQGGLLLVFDVTALAATPSVTPSLQVSDPAGAFVDLVDFSALTSIAVARYYVAPGPAAAGLDAAWGVAILARLPKIFWINMVHADADSITYTAWAAEVM